MLNYEQFVQMLKIQIKLNNKINENWVNENHDWTRAIMVEGVEAIEHHGWKWWKKQECDVDQLKLELVDIFHFAISFHLENCLFSNDLSSEGLNSLFNFIYDEYKEAADTDYVDIYFGKGAFYFKDKTILELLDLMVSLAGFGKFSFPVFFQLMNRLKFEWSELFKLYIGKSTLNLLRNDYGYNEGTYIKIWDGAEDNQVLMAALEKINPQKSDFSDFLYGYLENHYLRIIRK